MPRPLSFDHLQAILRQHTAGLPDVRKPSPNTRYTIQNAALGAFGIFFMQAPSFLEYQRQLNQRQGHDNAPRLFGVAPLPGDPHLRTLLAPLAPRSCHPVFVEVLEHLEPPPWCASWRVLAQQWCVARDGPQSFSSPALHGHDCLTRQLSHGPTLSAPTAMPPVMVCPGHAPVSAGAPAYSLPHEGPAHQDGEPAAGKRWLPYHASTLLP